MRCPLDWNSFQKQRQDEHSLLNWYRKQLQLRNTHSTLAYATTEFVPCRYQNGATAAKNDSSCSEPAPVMCLLRRTNDETILIIHNLSHTDTLEITADLSAIKNKGFTKTQRLFGGLAPAPLDGSALSFYPAGKLPPLSTEIILLK